MRHVTCSKFLVSLFLLRQWNPRWWNDLLKVTQIFSFKAKVRVYNIEPSVFPTTLCFLSTYFTLSSFSNKSCLEKFQRQMHLQLHFKSSFCNCHTWSLSQCLNPITGDNLNRLKLLESVHVAIDPPHSKNTLWSARLATDTLN